MFRWALIAIAAMPLLSTAAASTAAAEPASDDFYSGKTVRIIIGTTTAGEYGAYAQLMAQHIGRFVPGKPTVIVQTMVGGAGLVALNHVAIIAPQDGTVLSLPHANIVQDGLLNPRAQFDPARFQWIGRLASVVQVGVASSQSKARSIEDAKLRELIAGAFGCDQSDGPQSAHPQCARRDQIQDRDRLQGDQRCPARLGARRSRCRDHELGWDH
jgi:hypothetical protein